MSNPKGMRTWTHAVEPGMQLHVYSDERKIVLQLRRSVPTAEDLLTPSFKVAVELAPADALALAGELLSASARTLTAQGSLAEESEGVQDDQ